MKKQEEYGMLLRNDKGMVLPIVLSFIVLVLFSVFSMAQMVRRDAHMIDSIKLRQQARYLAEAGINHAFASLRKYGMASRADFADSLDVGSYSVTYQVQGSRILITSTGTVSGKDVSVSAEIRDNTATALNYFSGAGNDLKIRSQVTDASIVGDIHANNNVFLMAVGRDARLDIDGYVSATGIVQQGNRHNVPDVHDTGLYIRGENNEQSDVEEDAERITFPEFNLESYRALAMDSGDYYPSDKDFKNISLDPGNGIVYVEGRAKFSGSCTIKGGIVAEEVLIVGTLNQTKKGDRNVIIAMAQDGDIRINGKLHTEEALVVAFQDIRAVQANSQVNVSGTLLAERDIDIRGVNTKIDYKYIRMDPADMTGTGGEGPFTVISWNS